MSPIAKRGLLLTGGFLVLVAAMAASFVSFDSASGRGVAVGVALGVVNLVVGLLVTRWSLDQGGMKSASATIAGGFGLRLLVLVALFLAFRQTSTVDAAAFGLTFVGFFFVYLAAEIILVERHRAPRPA